MERRLLFYFIWVIISFFIFILVSFITAIAQNTPFYLYLVVYLPFITISASSFAILLKDKWWVSILEGIFTIMLPWAVLLLDY